jgi:DNA-binding IclR family transcriptional regulator
MKQKPEEYSSVQKAIGILMAFTPHNLEMGTLELSQRLGIHQSTVSRLLGVLTYYNLLQQNPSTKKYHLGKATADLGRAINRSHSTQLVSIAQPFMDRLRDSVGESVSLEVMFGSSVILLTESPGPPPVSVAFNVGERVPLHVASGAKVVLAFSPPELIDKYINGKLKRYTPNTIINQKMFKSQLAEVRQQGVAYDRGEYNIDVFSIGAPIFNHVKKPIAAISVCAPAYRMKSRNESDLVSQLKKTAAEISAQLFYQEKKD